MHFQLAGRGNPREDWRADDPLATKPPQSSVSTPPIEKPQTNQQIRHQNQEINSLEHPNYDHHNRGQEPEFTLPRPEGRQRLIVYRPAWNFDHLRMGNLG